ncbi:LYR motif-containing protein 2-like [Sycon ciliatum]|uniref:LYR motif-containing protein 2-like n=1 Tax=Sycon ciliatum TaxID=27933 RepID=UPI0031F6149E
MSPARNLLGSSVPSLKQFLHRQRVIRLYRTLLKTARRIPDEDYRREISRWTKEGFRQYQHEANEDIVRVQMGYGEKSLKELQQTIALAR